MNHLEHCAELEVEIARFATILETADPLGRVPSCPAWSIHDLAGHLGGIHRWAEYLVRVRSQVRMSSHDMGLDAGPPSAAWILEGGTQLLVALRSCDPDAPMWAWGADQHARFWSRRQLHETLMHRIDLELAVGVEPRAASVVAADGIDEFLVNLPFAATFSPGVRELTGSGSRLAFKQADGDRRWVVVLGERGISYVHDDVPADVELVADTLELLLILYRRRQIDEADVSITGDGELLRFWLARSALG